MSSVSVVPTPAADWESAATRYRELTALAARVARLIESTPQIRDALDYAVGSLHALFCAHELHYTDRTGRLPDDYWAAPLKRAQDMAAGRVRKDGKWAAGFYFNSAVVRIAADYHRTLKAITGEPKGDIPTLRKLVTPSFEDTNLDCVRDDVNCLKHDVVGLSAGRKVNFAIAVGALAELVDLIEDHQTELAKPSPPTS